MGSVTPPAPKTLPAALSPKLAGREAIQDALHRFAVGMDTNDVDLFMSAFTSDARWDLSGKSVHGLKSILSECYFYDIVKLDTTHYTTNVRINIAEDGSEASLHCLYVAYHWTLGTGMQPHSKRFTTGGTYWFDAVQDHIDGLWKFRYFKMVKQWSEGDFTVMGHKNPKDVAMLKNESAKPVIMPKLDFPHTPSDKIQLSVAATPGHTHFGTLTNESALKTSELLTINHSAYHNRWAQSFHNHITHHLLAIWSLGATPMELQEMWDYNVPYQSPIKDVTQPLLDLSDDQVFKDCLGRDDHYFNFVNFFRDEIDKKGVPDIVREYVLKGDDRANDIFCRMYTDLVHPMIHLGCGIEWKQPSIVAEALAGACTHANWPKDFLLPTEAYVRDNPTTESTTLLDMLRSLHHDPEIVAGIREDDPFNKIADGLMKRISGDKWAPYLSLYRVKPTPEDIQRSASEMMHTGAYIMGSAQKPGKQEAMDFALLHNVTLAGYYPAIIAQDWITNEEKARLLEAKARVDAVTYAGCGSPKVYAHRIADYVPKHVEHGWPELIHRSIVYRDEGHAAKLMRSLYSLEEHFPGPIDYLPIEKKHFMKVAHMAMDSIERAMEPDGAHIPKEKADNVKRNIGKGGEMVVDNMTRWVFYCGLPNAWNHVLDR